MSRVVESAVLNAESEAVARRMKRRYRRRQLPLYASMVMLFVIAIMAIFAPWIATTDPSQLAPLDRLQAPSWAHYFGTDGLGRDVYSRVVWGARVSLIVAIVVATLTTFFGVMFGLITAFTDWADRIIMRIVDGMMAIPDVLLAIALVALVPPSLTTVIVAIVIPQIPRMIRLVRSVALTLRDRPFVEAAHAIGTPLWLILLRHVAPNTMAAVLVEATFVGATAVLTEAVLSFLGVGVPAGVPSWGSIVADGRNVILVGFHVILFPSILIALTVLAINTLGDGLRDLIDPRMAGNT